MTSTSPLVPPSRFLRAMRKALVSSGLSVREAAGKADISPAYLSRLMAGERASPSSEILARLEHVLDVQPRGQLFDAAGRHDQVVAKVVGKDDSRLLMRSLAPLTAGDFAKVVKLARELASNYESK